MVTDRPFEELNLWQRIFAEKWEAFRDWYREKEGHEVPDHWEENVSRMLKCGDIREGYYEYLCEKCGETKKVGFTCKCRLCLRCFKVSVDNWLKTAKKILFEGVVHRQIVLTVPKRIRALILAESKFLKVYMDAGGRAVKELVEEWRPKKKIRVGIMAVLQVYGRAGNPNPHLHFVVSEGGIDKDNQWRHVNYFDTKKLRKKWQYHVLTGLKKAVKGTAYEREWYGKLGQMFNDYPTGFDCDAMPEKGAVDRLVVYLCKYVSSPPISIRRIEAYDGEKVTYRYEDHRKGLVRETLPAIEFIGRMIRHLPEKGFRMVRYYGIYARTVRNKIHEMVAEVLKHLSDAMERAREIFERLKARHGGPNPDDVKRIEEQFGDRKICCPRCGSVMLLIRIWSKTRGLVYELTRDGLSPVPSESLGNACLPRMPEQLAFAF